MTVDPLASVERLLNDVLDDAQADKHEREAVRLLLDMCRSWYAAERGVSGMNTIDARDALLAFARQLEQA